MDVFLQNRMDPIGDNIGEGDQNKAALRHPGVGEDQPGAFQDELIEKDQVNIQWAGAPLQEALPAGGLFDLQRRVERGMRT